MKKGFSLAEMLVVVAIFTVMFAVVLTFFVSANRNWQTGQDKLTCQQEARRAMDEIARLIRQSNPDWVIGETHYPLAITDSGQRIDFYCPIFDSNGAITTLKKITFKPNPANSRELLKKEGLADAVVIANELESINFGGGCLNCSSFNCSPLANDCPVVKIQIDTEKNIAFSLTSRITLRNRQSTLSAGTEVEEPTEGEF